MSNTEARDFCPVCQKVEYVLKAGIFSKDVGRRFTCLMCGNTVDIPVKGKWSIYECKLQKRLDRKLYRDEIEAFAFKGIEKDLTLQCRWCGKYYISDIKEQRYNLVKGIETPMLCLECRAVAKVSEWNIPMKIAERDKEEEIKKEHERELGSVTYGEENKDVR